jgi:hypothetical protein
MINKSIKGRRTANTVAARYLDNTREEIDDGWDNADTVRSLHTMITVEKPKTIICYNKSPDIPFESSINPCRGCEHGCIYCYARPRMSIWISRREQISNRNSLPNRMQRKC